MTCCSSGTTPELPSRDKSTPWGVARLVGAVFLTGNCMLGSLVVNISELTCTERRVMYGALLILTGTVAALCRQRFASRALLRQWRQGQGRVEGLFGLGMLGATAQSMHSVWVGGGDIYLEVVCVLLVVYHAASEIKDKSQQRVKAALEEALPATQRVRRVCGPDGGTILVPLAEVASGDHILVQPGEDILADGTIVTGIAFVHEALLTGESFCVTRRPTERVHAGTRVVDGPLCIRVDATVGHRHIDHICGAMVRGLGLRSHIELYVERVAGWLLGCAVAVAAITWAGWYALGGGLAPAIMHAMAVLLVACPCALGFATPLGLYTAVIRMARMGFVTRTTAAVERLSQIDTVVFDKTGTLTALHLSVTDLMLVPDSLWSRDDVIAMTRAAQSLSHHPIASAFASLVLEDTHYAYRPQALRNLPGRGIQATICGANASMQLEVVTLDGHFKHSDASFARAMAARSPGQRLLGIFIDHRLAAVASMTEMPIKSSRATLKRLHKAGLRCTVLTGDSATRLAPWYPSDSQGDLRSEDKAAYVRKLALRGHHVCFVGDGVNDAPAMAASYASMAISTGAPLAVAAADVTLDYAALSQLPQAIQAARQTMQTVRSNLYLAAGYNIAGMAVAAAGLLHPVFAACMMLCASLTVTLRSAKLLQPEELSV